MDFRVFSRNISEIMHARCVREDTKQALKGNLQADGVQSRQTLFVRYCPKHRQCRCDVIIAGFPAKCQAGGKSKKQYTEKISQKNPSVSATHCQLLPSGPFCHFVTFPHSMGNHPFQGSLICRAGEIFVRHRTAHREQKRPCPPWRTRPFHSVIFSIRTVPSSSVLPW